MICPGQSAWPVLSSAGAKFYANLFILHGAGLHSMVPAVVGLLLAAVLPPLSASAHMRPPPRRDLNAPGPAQPAIGLSLGSPPTNWTPDLDIELVLPRVAGSENPAGRLAAWCFARSRLLTSVRRSRRVDHPCDLQPDEVAGWAVNTIPFAPAPLMAYRNLSVGPAPAGFVPPELPMAAVVVQARDAFVDVAQLGLVHTSAAVYELGKWFCECHLPRPPTHMHARYAAHIHARQRCCDRWGESCVVHAYASCM